MQITLNEVFRIHSPAPDTVRVLYSDGERVVVISLLKKDTLPYEIPQKEFGYALEDQDAEVSGEYPVAVSPNPTEAQERAMERAWKIIGTFVTDIPDCYDRKIRSRYIAAKSEEAGVTRKQVQRYLYRYWAGGMTKYALCPQYEKRGAPGKSRNSGKKIGRPVQYPRSNAGVKIGSQELLYIQEAIEKHYTKHTKYSLRYAYREMLKAHYTDAVTGTLAEAYPTESQFRYHAHQFVDVKKRAGAVAYNKDMRGITGSSRQEADGPGDLYQIDATIADVYLVAHDDRQAVVGRPELYFVTDVFSRMIVGFYTCLESASWDNARSALLNAFTDKVAFCEQYGIQITEEQWPCKGLPRALAVDNGELISKASNAIIEGLGITVKNEPAWRPDLKGIVESRFRLLNLETKAKLPGSVLPDFRQRGAPDYRLDATLTLTDFTKIVIYFVLDHNRRQMERHPQPLPDILKDSVPAIPLALWQWGITHRAGSLRQMEPELLQVALSQRAQATVTPRGIKFHALFYQCETAMEENWFSTARIKRGWKIDIAYHPSAMERIYWLKKNGEPEECTQTEDSRSRYSGDTLEEIDWMQRRQKQQKAAYGDISLQSNIDSSKAIDEVIQNANREKKTIPFEPVKQREQARKIRENRKAEVAKLRAATEETEDAAVQPEQDRPEKESGTLRSTSAYGALFARFLEDEEDT